MPRLRVGLFLFSGFLLFSLKNFARDCPVTHLAGRSGVFTQGKLSFKKSF